MLGTARREVWCNIEKHVKLACRSSLHHSMLLSQVRSAYLIAEVRVVIQQRCSRCSLFCSAWVAAALHVLLLLHPAQLQDLALLHIYQGAPATQEVHVNCCSHMHVHGDSATALVTMHLFLPPRIQQTRSFYCIVLSLIVCIVNGDPIEIEN